MKLVLFDCDDTLWDAPNGDYISSAPSTFSLHGNVIVRNIDQAKFKLKPGASELIKALHAQGVILGVVSDNIKEPVIQVLELFGLLPYFFSDAINVRLWKGPCPKHIMVQEILSQPIVSSIQPNEVLWVDDKDYHKEAASIGVNFHRVTALEPLSNKIIAS